MRVVLVNAQTAMHHHAEDKPHEALLIVDKKNLVNNSLRPTIKYEDDFFRIGSLHAFRLDGVDLRFPDPSARLIYDPVDLKSDTRTKDCPRGESDRFDWIAQMPESSDMKASVLSNSPNKAEVLARMPLFAGKLSTTGFRRSDKSGSTKVVKWQFEDDRGHVIGSPLAIAEETELKFEVNDMDNVFRIDITPYGGSANHVLLNPAPDGTGGMQVRIWIVNMPLLNVISEVKGDPEAPEVHFLHYYDLSASGSHYPHRIDDCDDIGGGGLTGPKCPTVQFADHIDA
jgi:hypothetical protein